MRGRMSVVDVPGHERFVRTMVAGATGIDLYLMVVAADDGVMPQTREHAAVLAALGVRVGVVAITKTDLAVPGAGRAPRRRDLLPGAEIVAVSSRTGEGLGDAAGGAGAGRRAGGEPSGCGPAAPARRPRLQRPRGGHGRDRHAVVGRGGARRERDRAARRPPRAIRGVEVHDEPVERAEAGQRVALNLAGVDRDEVARGDVIVGDAAPRGAAARGAAGGGQAAAAGGGSRGASAVAALAATYRVDVAITWATPEARPDGGARVAVHHGTRESAARLVELGGRFFQLRLEDADRARRRRSARASAASPRRTRSAAASCSTRTPPARPEPRPARPARPARARRARTRGRARTPGAGGARAAAPRSARARSSSSSGSSEPATSRRSTRSPSCSPRCESTAARSASARPCTSTPTRSTRSTTCVVAAIERDGQITLAGLRDELEHVTQVRAGLPRALRRDEGHAAPGRGAGPAPPALNAASQNASSCSRRASRTRPPSAPGRRRPRRAATATTRPARRTRRSRTCRSTRGIAPTSPTPPRRRRSPRSPTCRRDGRGQLAEVAQRGGAQQEVAVGGGRRAATRVASQVRPRPTARRTRGAAPSRSPSTDEESAANRRIHDSRGARAAPRDSSRP